MDLTLSTRFEHGTALGTDAGAGPDAGVAAGRDYAVIEVTGEVDVYTAPRLRESLLELVDEGHYDVIVDIRGVEFLDSTGLGVLVGGLKRVRQHDGSIQLVCSQERILKIFRITGLTKVFAIRETVEEALAAP